MVFSLLTRNLPNFLAVAVAILASGCLNHAASTLSHGALPGGLQKTLQKASPVPPGLGHLTDKNLEAEKHSAFCSDGFLASLSRNFFNFGTIFADKLIPTDVLSSSRRIMSGAPGVTELLTEEAVRRFLLVGFLLDPSPLAQCLQFPAPARLWRGVCRLRGSLCAVRSLMCFFQFPCSCTSASGFFCRRHSTCSVRFNFLQLLLTGRVHLLGQTAPILASGPVMSSQARWQAWDPVGCPVSTTTPCVIAISSTRGPAGISAGPSRASGYIPPRLRPRPSQPLRPRRATCPQTARARGSPRAALRQAPGSATWR